MNYQYKSIVSPPTSLPADLIVDIREKAVEFAERCIRNPPKANSKAHVGRIWPFLWENTKWASWNVQPTFSLFTPPYTLFPSKGELPDDYLYFPWSDDLYRGDLTEDHPRNRYYQAAAGLKSLIDHAYKHGLLKLGSAEWKDDYLLSHFTPGRLAFKMEGAGKVRTFAIPNSVKQALLRPAYERPEEHSNGCCRSSPGRDPESSKLVYPQAKFSNVALLGDDIVIADPRVAERYLDIINQLGVQVSKQKSRIFHTGCFEFAKKFIIHSETARLVSSERENVALLSTFDRLDACFPEGFIPSPYQVGKVRWFLIESCEPDWSFSEKLMKSLEGNVSEDTQFLIERKMVAHWMESMLAYYKWYLNALSDYSISCDVLLDPPAFVFRPARKEQLNKFHKYGRMFRAYDLVRQEPVPLPLGEIPRPLYYVDVRRAAKLVWKNCCAAGNPSLYKFSYEVFEQNFDRREVGQSSKQLFLFLFCGKGSGGLVLEYPADSAAEDRASCNAESVVGGRRIRRSELHRIVESEVRV
ncbi:hypothetical protein MRB53_036310 [Persea americana]|nr:hypothetical protein MRB53_036654 [Persea americana]KAJ8614897.1 hypothetical protein MRB53_036310 [Persea americana]